MNIKDVHPVRAILAVGVIGATVYALLTGINITEAWWAIAAMVVTFYFST